MYIDNRDNHFGTFFERKWTWKYRLEIEICVLHAKRTTTRTPSVTIENGESTLHALISSSSFCAEVWSEIENDSDKNNIERKKEWMLGCVEMAAGLRRDGVENRQTCSQICGIWSADIRNKGQHTYLCNIKCKFKDVNILHKKDAHSMVAAVFVSVHHEYSNSYLMHFHIVWVCACVYKCVSVYVFCIGFEWPYLIFFGQTLRRYGKTYVHTHIHTARDTHTHIYKRTRAHSHHINILMGHICNVESY